MTTTFIPITHIPVIKNIGFGKTLGILYPKLDYVADDFKIDDEGKITFTLNDEQGWIGDYETESKVFFVEYS